MTGPATTAPGRTLGSVEQTWCRAVLCGTGTTVLALQMARPESHLPLLHRVLEKLLLSHPLLRCKLHYNPTTKGFSFLPSAAPLAVAHHDIPTTALLLRRLPTKQTSHLPPCHLIMEHELNDKTWRSPAAFPCALIHTALYTLSESHSVIALRLHAAACDRTTAESVLREMMELVAEAEGRRGFAGVENGGEGEVGIEGLVPRGVAKKTVWAHGMDMLGYSLSSLRLTNLKFKNAKAARYSEVVRLKMDTHQTAALLAGCKSRGIKLCGALAAAGLMAAHSTRLESDKLKKKYGVVTLIDTRSLLDPPLTIHHFGYYQLAIVNTHTISGGEELWDLAERCYSEFAHEKRCNTHFSDMADLSFLMRKAMENPSLTAAASLRSSVISVFEDPVIDNTKEMKKEIGVEDYIGCSSAHGVGPSLAVFDTVRNGQLDCACVYPAPLHSRDQITQLVAHMKKILLDATF